MNSWRAAFSAFWARLTRAGRFGKASALIAFAAGIAAGAVLYLGVDGLYVKLTAPPPGGAAMTAIGNDLAESASVRPSFEAAIIQVQSCIGNVSDAQTAVNQTIANREAILANLKTLSVSDLPNGARMVSTLTAAMQAALEADHDYYAWMTDIVAAGRCVPFSQDANYTKGENASASANNAKRAFLAIWNVMAPRYGQQTYSVTGF